MTSAKDRTPAPAQPSTDEHQRRQFPSVFEMLDASTVQVEREAGIKRLERVLSGMILMLRENPDIPLPWTVDMNCQASKPEFDRILETHGLDPLGVASWMVHLTPIAERYVTAEDRGRLYMPWSVTIRQDQGSL